MEHIKLPPRGEPGSQITRQNLPLKEKVEVVFREWMLQHYNPNSVAADH
jgi:hypothetical protein